MNIRILLNNLSFVFRVVVVAGIAMFTLFVAQATSPADIQFPVVELENCADKKSCKAYCSNADHRDVCMAFAERHNLRGGHGENDSEKLKAVAKDGGPGGCAVNAEDPRASCEAYCADREHMRTCVAYAKDHNLMNDGELRDAEKVLKALDSGIKLPAACTDERSCQKTCEEPKDIETARQCFAFAEAAGLLPPGVDRGKAEKMFKAISEGKAPFKSPRDFKQCENPSSDEIFEKCVAFALENGFIPPEQVEMVKKTRGKGPGGCRGKEQCDVYCAEHQDECVAFAEEHGLMREEDKARRQEGTLKFKEALKQAPPEVVGCLKETVGEQVLDDIVAGKTPPSRDLGEKMHACFEKFFGPERERPTPPDQSFQGETRNTDERMMRGEEPLNESKGDMMRGRGSNAPAIPPQVRACIEAKIGAKGFEDMSRHSGDPMNSSFGPVIRDCYESAFRDERKGGEYEAQNNVEFKSRVRPETRSTEQKRIPEQGFMDENRGHVPEAQNSQFKGRDPRVMPNPRSLQEGMPYQRGESPYGEPQNGMHFPPDYREPGEGTYQQGVNQMPNRDGSYPPPYNASSPEGFHGEGLLVPTNNGSVPSHFFVPPSGENFSPPQPSSAPSSFLPRRDGAILMANVMSVILRR